jgi:hypothetical protein
MVFPCGKNNDSSDDGANKKGQINLYIGEENEPFVPCALLELAGRFCATDAACWVLSADTCRKSASETSTSFF